MKTASPELVALLASGRFVFAELFTFTQLDGTIYRWTTADVDVSWGGHAFSSSGPTLERGNIHHAVGVEVDTMELTIVADPAEHLIAGLPYPHYARNGGFDGTRVLFERAYMADWSTPVVGALTKFSGAVSDVTPSRTQVVLSVKSDLELLNVKAPHNLYQAPCLHSVYNSGCGLIKANFAVAGVVAAGSTTTQIACALAQAAGWFDQGTITFTAGENAGVMRTVKSYAPGLFKLSLPLPAVPAPGDTFNAYAGCDRCQVTCDVKFNNKPNFRATPYVPIPETAL
jgi:uncharacterized phage protein (TIGR02218 family)